MMGKHTPFYELHCLAHAKIVDFFGWEMPLHYGSQIKEHHQVRQAAGFFDVSHMGLIDLRGNKVTSFLKYLLANNVDRLVAGKALYTCMLNEQGGVIDDLIVYQIAADYYRLVVNAGTREKDVAWIRQQAQAYAVQIHEPQNLAMLAVQGPASRNIVASLIDQASLLEQLKPFHFIFANDMFIACTGYTGEDGFEIIFPAEQVSMIWQRLIDAGATPCGLGARDTLRLEAGLNLYGQDMDEAFTPFESNLAWTVAFEPAGRQFIGREALLRQQKTGLSQHLVGLVLEGAGIIRQHQRILIHDQVVGEVTSGGYAPSLEKSIALARVREPIEAHYMVEIRDKLVPASMVKPPFVRKGKKMFVSVGTAGTCFN